MRQRGAAVLAWRGVEQSGDAPAGLEILRGEQPEQRPGASEDEMLAVQDEVFKVLGWE